jgi:hypothetical protein
VRVERAKIKPEVFSRQAILNSETFKEHRDLLSALLPERPGDRQDNRPDDRPEGGPDNRYTVETVKRLISGYMKKEVL